MCVIAVYVYMGLRVVAMVARFGAYSFYIVL